MAYLLSCAGDGLNKALSNTLEKSENLRKAGGKSRLASHVRGIVVVVPVGTVALVVNVVRVPFEILEKIFVKLARVCTAIFGSCSTRCANWNERVRKYDNSFSPFWTVKKICQLVAALFPIGCALSWITPGYNYSWFKCLGLTNNKIQPDESSTENRPNGDIKKKKKKAEQNETGGQTEIEKDRTALQTQPTGTEAQKKLETNGAQGAANSEVVTDKEQLTRELADARAATAQAEKEKKAAEDKLAIEQAKAAQEQAASDKKRAERKEKRTANKEEFRKALEQEKKAEEEKAAAAKKAGKQATPQKSPGQQFLSPAKSPTSPRFTIRSSVPRVVQLGQTNGASTPDKQNGVGSGVKNRAAFFAQQQNVNLTPSKPAQGSPNQSGNPNSIAARQQMLAGVFNKSPAKATAQASNETPAEKKETSPAQPKETSPSKPEKPVKKLNMADIQRQMEEQRKQAAAEAAAEANKPKEETVSQQEVTVVAGNAPDAPPL